MTSTPGLSNDTLQLINLPLRTSERPKLDEPQMSVVYSFDWGRNPMGEEMCPRTRFFASFLARLSLLFLKSSMTRRS